MRVLAAAAVLLLSTGVAPSFAQPAGSPQSSSQPQTTPVQPERTPQQSEQSREQGRDRGDEVQLRRDWRVQQRDSGRMGQSESGRMMDQDQRTVGQDWRARRDEESTDRYRGPARADRDMGYSDEDRPRRRMKVCFEYDNGDEVCRYR
jgi:hypothetical protein